MGIEHSKNGLAYALSGNPDGAPLVFVNGLGGLQESWFYQGRRFSEEHCVLTYDHRGNGRSPFRDGPARMQTYVDDLLQILDEVSIEAAHFVGISFGSRLLQELALSCPARVRSITLCAATSAPAEPEGASVLKEMGSMTVERFMEDVVPLLFGAKYVAANHKRLEAFARGRMRRPTDPRGLAMQWEAICHFDSRDRLSSIGVPALIIHGKEDRLTPFRAAERLAAGIPNATLVGLEGIGHSPQVEDAEAFNAALSTFLTGLV